MMNKAKPSLGAAAVFLGFSVVAWKLPPAFNLSGGPLLAVRLGLLLLGLALAVLVGLVVRARTKSEPEVPGGAEIDEAVVAAEARLASSKMAADARLGRLPLALVLGPSGSTKTSIVMHSGLDPELLSGEVMRSDSVIATDPLNIWYAHGTVIVEAGGALLEDAPRWGRLLRRLQPRRLAAAMGRGRQSPRVAILCFACDDFVKPGASQNLHTLGRQLRARLAEASQLLGIRLPVYVLFTRADRLPFFADYVRSFTNDEAHQVLGTTLPLGAETASTWAEREAGRLNDAFARIVRTLAVRRIDVLPRETQEQVRAGAYEFPRELRKIAEPAVQLMLDIFRPSQLGVNPFLRGFYFTGVRPVIIRDVAGESFAAPRAAASGIDAGATSVFNAAMLQQAMQQAAQAPGGGRKVPQWVFLQRLFRDVVLSDDVALNITRSGTRVDLLRRGLIGAAAAACLLFSVGFTWSYAKNRQLIVNARDAATFAADARSPYTEDLAKLDSLRRVTATVADLDRRKVAPGYSWGLYRGHDVHQTLRTFYFDRFRTALWDSARTSIIGFMRALPERPGPDSDFNLTHDALGAHLLTTSEVHQSTPEKLTEWIMAHWRPVDPNPEAAQLANQQFAFFASELRQAKPYADEAEDPALVRSTRRFLREFGTSAYYAALRARANEVRAVTFPTTGQLVSRGRVEGAFTVAGWRLVEENLAQIDKFWEDYRWLYGDSMPANRPTPAQLQQLYQQDYVNAWLDYLAKAEIARFPNLNAAAGGLEALADPGSSPLFRFLLQVSQNTGLPTGPTDSVINKRFTPVHALVPPADVLTLGPALAQYAGALGEVAAKLRALQPGETPDATVAFPIQNAALAAIAPFLGEAQGMAASSHLRRLLEQPAQFVNALARSAPGEDLNRTAGAICDAYTIAGAFPFDPQSRRDAGLDAVKDLLGPDGQIEAFRQTRLNDRLSEQGTVRPGAAVNPQYAAFFAAAARFRSALFRTDAGPALEVFVRFALPPSATRVIMQVGSDEATWTAASGEAKDIAWFGERSAGARIVVEYGSERVVVAEAPGSQWGLFRVFYAAREVEGNRFRWGIEGKPGLLEASVALQPGVQNVLERGSLNTLNRCIRTVANR